ncbi:MAG: hypothetical protein JXR58_03090 [Bacteroidales bacterium]|nr:hypothetical protein [Bacteroidales bacterium]
MKAKFFFFVLLISLLGFSQVKADTIYTTLPHPVQYFCEDVNDFTTFVFYKPTGFLGVTDWFVNSIPVGSGDSIIFIPTAVGFVDITAEWNGNWEGTLIYLYSDSPPHPTFDVLSGGQVNISGDTAWMCDPSLLLVADNISGDDHVYMQWSGPGGNMSGNPITVTTSGRYYFERSNPCGVTLDSIEVIALPTQAPFWNDTVFCNATVSLTLDVGPGWISDWNTTETTQSIYVDTAGTYIVQLTNACANTSASITVEEQTYPIPDLSAFMGFTMCADSVILLDPSPGYTYDSYEWSWLTGTATTPTLTVSGLTTGSGIYNLTVTQGSCVEMTCVFCEFFLEPLTPEICLVSVDPAINKNMVMWLSDMEPFPGDPQYPEIASYNIYKAVGVNSWQLLGNSSVTMEYTFIDYTSNPSAYSSVYKITAVDECGVESLKSFYHKTINLTLSNVGSTMALNWEAYEVEDESFIPDKYYIYRGEDETSFELIDSVSGYVHSYNDIGVYEVYYYMVGAVRSDCDFTNRSAMSNRADNEELILSMRENNGYLPLSIYPNPATNQITISLPKELRITN